MFCTVTAVTGKFTVSGKKPLFSVFLKFTSYLATQNAEDMPENAESCGCVFHSEVWSLKYSNVSQLGLFRNTRRCNHGFLLFTLGFYCWARCGTVYNVTLTQLQGCWEESKRSQPDPVQWETPLVFLHLAEHSRILVNLHEHTNISNRRLFW